MGLIKYVVLNWFFWEEMCEYMLESLYFKSYYLVYFFLEVWFFLLINIYDKVFVKEMFGLLIGMKFIVSYGI